MDGLVVVGPCAAQRVFAGSKVPISYGDMSQGAAFFVDTDEHGCSPACRTVAVLPATVQGDPHERVAGAEGVDKILP